MAKDKYKIRISNRLNSFLNVDMYTFNFYKPNDKVNKNKFYSMVINGMYEYYLKDNNIIFNTLCDEAQNDKNFNKNLADSINKNLLKTHHSDLNDFLHPVNIYIQTTKENQDTFNKIEANSLKNETFSEFVRNLLIKYISLPIYLREMIIFKDSYHLLKSSFKESIEIIVTTNDNKQYLFRQFGECLNGDETNYYFIGEIVIGNRTELKSFKLSDIKHITLTDNYYKFTKEKLEYISSKIIHGPELIDSNEDTIELQFDNTGVDIYFKNERGRPLYINCNEDTNIFTFQFNEDKMFNYLKIFGKHVKVIRPLSLKTKLKDFYKSAINE